MHLQGITPLHDYENILIVNEEGRTIFYDMADLSILQHLGFKPENFIGEKVTHLYKDLPNEESTILSVLQSGEPLCGVTQRLTAQNGFSYSSFNSTFPIKVNGKTMGAIEFSKIYYGNGNIQTLESYSSHKIYRRNNTIYTIDDLLTCSPSMQHIKDIINKISKTDSPIWIEGPQGTGKEIIAQSLHNLSDRFTKPYIYFNCSAIEQENIDAVLFGHSEHTKPSILKEAQGGTLYIDDAHKLPLTTQVRLYRVIEEQVFNVNSNDPTKVSVRLVFATPLKGEELIKEQTLREDFFYRMSVVSIQMPPLVERKEDISVLVHYFIHFFNQHMHVQITHIDEKVLELFEQYPWPGNVRELKNAIETAYNHTEDSSIKIEDLPKRIVDFQQESRVINKYESKGNLKECVDFFERDLIVKELKNSHGNLAETARKVGVSKQLLKYKMQKYHLR